MDALCTLPQVKTLWGISSSDTTYDALLNLLIPRVSAMMIESMNRTHVITAEITEFLSGANNPLLLLSQWPVRSITNIWVQSNAYWGQAAGSFGADSLLVAGQDYALRKDQPDGSSKSGVVFRIGSVWQGTFTYDYNMLTPLPTPGYGNVKVTYSCGWDAVPDDMNMAALLVMGKVRQTKNFGAMMKSESYEEYAYSLMASDISEAFGFLGGEVGSILNKYRITPMTPFG